MMDSGVTSDEAVLREMLHAKIDSSCACHVVIVARTRPVNETRIIKDSTEAALKSGARFFLIINSREATLWRVPGDKKQLGILVKAYPPLKYQASAGVDQQTRIALKQRVLQISNDLISLRSGQLFHSIETDATFFVNRLARSAEVMTLPVRHSLGTMLSRSPEFRKKIEEWSVKQALSNFGEKEFLESVSRQIVYRLLGKIIFYQSLLRHFHTLPEMNLDKVDEGLVVNQLQSYFQTARSIDYQAIFQEEIIDAVPFPQIAVYELKALIHDLNFYNFYSVPQDVIGQVFERLIPAQERHILGQYFTREDLVDLITAFCVKAPDANVLDPTCGTGTFLLRSYDRKQYLGEHSHEKLLKSLWGIDVANFPAELATINLYRQKLEEHNNFPRIIVKDFFEIKTGDHFLFPDPSSEKAEPIENSLPLFRAIVGNFPYIRQELLDKKVKNYKNLLANVVLSDWFNDYRELFDSQKRLRLSNQADLYVYLFFHAARFLVDCGRMGVVTSNTWLDVVYGYELQKFLLRNFRLVAIVESRCEPWFEEVSVNTVVTVIERRIENNDPSQHFVKFVKMKRRLKDVLPNDLTLERVKRWKKLDATVEAIENIQSRMDGTEELQRNAGVFSYEDDTFRIRFARQDVLLHELEESGRTVKWGKYLRAPAAYFQIISDVGRTLKPLKTFAQVRFGIKTGINEFFYLTDEKLKEFQIEQQFFRLVVKSPKEFSGISIDVSKLTTRMFLCNKSKDELKREGNTGALRYIEWGERQKTEDGIPWPAVPTVRNRKPGWWSLPEGEAVNLCWTVAYGDKFVQRFSPEKILLDKRFYRLVLNENIDARLLAAILNSTLISFFIELIGRVNLGDGALDTTVQEAHDYLFVPDLTQFSAAQKNSILKAFNPLLKRPIKSIFEEVKMPDRRQFDKVILEAVGLNADKYLQELYSGLCELVQERIQLAKMRGTIKKAKPRKDIDTVKNHILQEYLPHGAKRFPQDFLNSALDPSRCTALELPRDELYLGSYFFGEQEVTDGKTYSYKAKSLIEAKYLLYAHKSGSSSIELPLDTMTVFKAVKKYEMYLRDLKNSIAKALLSRTLDQRATEALLNQIFEENRLPLIAEDS